MAKVNEFLNRLHKLRQKSQNKWLACCPAHEDKNPSLSILYDDYEDKLVLKCWAGCSTYDIVSSVGMELHHLMPETGRGFGSKRVAGFTRHDAFDVLMNEATILMLAMGDVLNGKYIDRKRVKNAIQTIDNIRAGVK